LFVDECYDASDDGRRGGGSVDELEGAVDADYVVGAIGGYIGVAADGFGVVVSVGGKLVLSATIRWVR
jgi:hypothetical protein